MAVHKIFHDDPSSCAVLLPTAMTKLKEMRVWMAQAGVHTFSRKFDLPGGRIFIKKSGTEEWVNLWAGMLNIAGIAWSVYELGTPGVPASRVAEDPVISSSSAIRKPFRKNTLIPSPFSLEVAPTGTGRGLARNVSSILGELQFFITKNLRTFTATSPMIFIQPQTASALANAAYFPAPSSFVREGEAINTFGAMTRVRFTEFDPAEYPGFTRAVFAYTEDGGTTWTSSAFDVEGAETIAIPTWRVTPQQLLGLVCQGREGGDPSTGAFFVNSPDNGESWFVGPPSAPLMAYIEGLVGTDPVPVTSAIAQLCNNSASVTLTTGEVLFITKLVNEPPVKFRLVGGAFVFDGAVNPPSPGFPIAQGVVSWNGTVPVFLCQNRPVLFLTRPPSSENFENYHSAILVGDEEGIEWEIHVLPWVSRRTGLVTPYDEQTLIVASYDMEEERYILYYSLDLGVTWQPGGKFSPDIPMGAHPSLASGEIEISENYPIIWPIRRDGKPVPSTPGAPWVSDASYPLPWE